LEPNRLLFKRPKPTLDVGIGIRVIVTRSLLLDSGGSQSFDIAAAGHLASVVASNDKATTFWRLGGIGTPMPD
jgi:hypothetical protein